MRMPSRGLVIRLFLGLIFAISAGWLSVAISVASLMRNARPDIALRHQPWDARARAKAAENILAGTRGRVTAGTAKQVTELAREVLERDPTVVSAWRTLALLSRRPDQAATLFHFSGSLSRRDLPTQLWLIEESVRRNDIPKALSHYDVALRSSTVSQEILLPILVRATSERAILPPLAALLRTQPPWRITFLDALTSGEANPDNMVQLLTMIGRPANPEEVRLMTRSINRLVEQRNFGQAARLYQMLAGSSVAGQLLRNGRFDRPNVYPPLDWQLADSAEIRADQRPAQRSGERQGLYVYASTDTRGHAARQLLFLAPGTYVLTALSGRTDAPAPERLAWQITCANAASSSLLDRQTGPAGPAARAIESEFHVPSSGCPVQWLALQLFAGNEPQGSEAWVTSVRIEPAGQRR